jgi:hypothetical protein
MISENIPGIKTQASDLPVEPLVVFFNHLLHLILLDNWVSYVIDAWLLGASQFLC